MRKLVDGLYQFPKDYNPIIDYHEKIQSGEIKASKKITRLMEQLVQDINDVQSEYYYDNEVAHRPITFIENFLFHYKGKLGGKNFFLELWQRAIIASFFGFLHKETKLRKYRELLLVVARKNGKSLLASALAIYMQLHDGENAPIGISAATRRDQARLTFENVQKLLRGSPLAELAKIQQHEIITDFNNGSFKAVSAEAKNADGWDLSFAVLDEIHAWHNHDLYNVIVDSFSAREQGAIFITTTNGFVRNSIFDTKYSQADEIIKGFDNPDGYKNDSILPFIYELDAEKEMLEEENWEKANPGLGTIKSKEQLKEKVKQAIAFPEFKGNLLTKDFNRLAKSSDAWLDYDTLYNNQQFTLDEVPDFAIGGVDLSSTTDLTSASVLFVKDGKYYYKTMYWLPADTLETRQKEDNVPYDLWLQQGYLRVSEGNIIDYADVSKWFMELREQGIYVQKIGFDSWNGAYLQKELERIVGKGNVVEVRQGAKTLSQPMKEMASHFHHKNIIYDNNPITLWNLTNVYVQTDANGNIRPLKQTRHSKKRIDGFIGMINAFVTYQDNKATYDNLVTRQKEVKI